MSESRIACRVQRVNRNGAWHEKLVLLNAILYVAEHGCKWRGFAKRFWQLAQHLCAHESLGQERCIGSGVCQVCSKSRYYASRSKLSVLDSTSVKVHPDGTGALKKTDRKPSVNRAVDGTPRFILVAANARRQ